MQVKFLPTIVSLVFRKLGFPWVVLLATGTLAVTFEGLSNLVIGDNTIYIRNKTSFFNDNEISIYLIFDN